jgi:uncharacterized protein
MIERTDALSLIENYLKDEKIVKHSLAVEAIMIALAKRNGENEQIWSLVGLLHDLDYEYTKGNPEKHGILTAEILEGLLPREAINSILSHNYIHTDIVPTTLMDKALLASDAVSGLIIATALVMPSKKLADVKIETVLTKFKDSSFAKGCNRLRIQLCTDINLTLDEFLQVSLQALQAISKDLGL